MTGKPFQHAPDAPWLFRTYAGHSTAQKSNELYRGNLAKGQTGLSIAFDLPTQTGYDPDHILARGEVGKVGVPVSHLGDMRALFDQIPVEQMNTSMTINAPAAWMLSLYCALAEEQGADITKIQGTTQNDLIKEYLSRGTYIYPPGPSLRIISDMIAWCYKETPKFNPMNVCSYHLQEAGATPEQELAFALATAISVLDAVKAGGQVPDEDFPIVAQRISFFVNAGIRFVTEMCKMRAFTELWDEILLERYGVQDPKQRRFRYGVQVNSLGLTEPQPENNVYRILLEALAVTLSKDARARAVQLPAWNEALGLPRPFDQQWSLRLQQILAYETDLLEYEDLFEGSIVVRKKVDELKANARAELGAIDEMGGAVAAVESGYMKARLVEANTERFAKIESGEMTVVGVNRFTSTEPSPLTSGENAILVIDPAVEAQAVERMKAWKAGRDQGQVDVALAALKKAAEDGSNIMPPSIHAARVGVTTGEWAQTLRDVFGEYRAPTGVGEGSRLSPQGDIAAVRAEVERVSAKLRRRLKLLVGKPGLDGHSNGAEQIAVRARDCGFEVLYEGIRLTPNQIVNAALEESVHIVGLSILSGSHLALVEDVLSGMNAAGIGDIPLIVGGIIPPDDEAQLRAMGVSAVYTPKDFDLTAIMADMVKVAERAAESAEAA
jgi:(2R)-ethylmalonyl-CoA mutase